MRGLVISDTHMLRPARAAAIETDTLAAAVQGFDAVVFNGDVFDFEWFAQPSVEEAVAAALEWVEGLARQTPACHYVFVAGNHDHHHLYVEGMVRLCAQIANLHWANEFFRLGERVFLHGDAGHIGRRHHALHRFRNRWSFLRSRMVRYERLHRAISRPVMVARLLDKMPREIWHRRITRYLHSAMGEQIAGVREVYLGHTHVPFRDFCHAGLVFHNSGTVLRGETLTAIEFPVSALEMAQLRSRA